jgi:hypothetical protein
MSSSCVEPSKKVGWYKSILAKAKYDGKLLDLAKKGVKPDSLKLSKKYKERYAELQTLAGELNRKQEKKESDKNKQQKEKANG